MKGLFITFEGNEGSGKSTQIPLLAERLRELKYSVRLLREPGGTAIGEEIRHTLQHSAANQAMTAEAELLLMNASRAQLVREVIRPALAQGEMVLCDRFYDSTTAYQGHGRQLDLDLVQRIIDFAVGSTRPDVTLLLNVPLELSQARRLSRQAVLLASAGSSSEKKGALNSPSKVRDRMEEANSQFFARVEKGYQIIAAAEPHRVRVIDATQSVEEVRARVWEIVEPLLCPS